MKKKIVTEDQKKIDIDIWIIFVVTFVVFALYAAFGSQITEYVKNTDNNLVLRLFVCAGTQFGVAGLGVCIVSILRKERFSIHGLHLQNTLKAVVLTILCYVPYIIYIVASGNFEGYFPLHIMMTDEVLKSGFPFNVFGMLVIALMWGFFEGFNYVVVCDKIDLRYAASNKWVSYGALICSLFCILFHPFHTSFWGIIEIITTIIAIYGMLIVRKGTENAWGCIFAFVFIWNAF